MSLGVALWPVQKTTCGFQAFSTGGIQLETELGTKDMPTAVPKTIFFLSKEVRQNADKNKENEAVTSPRWQGCRMSQDSNLPDHIESVLNLSFHHPFSDPTPTSSARTETS